MKRGRLLFGAALAIGYVVVASATALLSTHHMRPLFDGFAPPPPYNWTKPPKEFARDNRQPTAAATRVDITAQGSKQASAGTSDGQALVTLNAGALPPRRGETQASVELTPADAGTLAPLPDALEATSNAYRVNVQYLPSNTEVARLAQDGGITLTAARHFPAMYHSSDGRTWTRVHGRALAEEFPGITATIRESGYYVLAGAPIPPQPKRGPQLTLIIGVALLALGGLLLLGRAAVVLRRRYHVVDGETSG